MSTPHVSKAVRLVAAARMFEAGNVLTAGELAARLGVNLRTAQRYLEDIEEIGIPLVEEPGAVAGPGRPPARRYRMFQRREVAS